MNVYKSELLSFLENFTTSSSLDIRSETAYLLAMLYDTRSWDIFNLILQKRTSEVTLIKRTCSNYAKITLSQNQSKHLIETLDRLSTKK